MVTAGGSSKRWQPTFPPHPLVEWLQSSLLSTAINTRGDVEDAESLGIEGRVGRRAVRNEDNQRTGAINRELGGVRSEQSQC